MSNDNFAVKDYSRVNSVNVLIIAIAFTLIWYYDTKWSLPIVVWLVIIAGVSPPALNWQYVLSILGLLGWVYLWLIGCGLLPFRKILMTTVLALLWSIVIENGLSVLRHYNYQLVFDQESSWFYIPSAIFILGSLSSVYITWLVRKL